MGLDPVAPEWMFDKANRLFITRIVSTNCMSKILAMLELEPNPQDDDPRETFKHHIRNNTPHEGPVRPDADNNPTP